MHTRIVPVAMLTAALGTLAGAIPAHAGGFVGFSFGIPLPLPVIQVAPAPVYAPAPCPPVAVYPAPPVYYAPPPYVREYYYRDVPAYGGPPYGHAWGHRRHRW